MIALAKLLERMSGPLATSSLSSLGRGGSRTSARGSAESLRTVSEQLLCTLMGYTEYRTGVAHGEPEFVMEASRHTPYRVLSLTSRIIGA